MINISINYYPTGISRWRYLFNRAVFNLLKPVEINRSVAQKWDELTEADLKAIAKARFFIKSDKTKEIFLVWHFLRIPYFIFKDLPEVDATDIHAHLSTLMGENVMRTTIFKKLENGWIGPSDIGGNISFYEFIKADTYYSRYVNTKDEKWINLLVATLYRPAKFGFKKSGDRRIPFDEWTLPDYADEAVRINRNTRYAILLQYSGFRQWLEGRYPKTFSEKKPGKFGWPGTITGLAGEKFGNTEGVKNTLLHTVLIHLETSAEEAERVGV